MVIFVLIHFKNHKPFRFIDLLLSEIIIEKLLEQRDFYLNTLKHLEFQLVIDSSQKEIKDTKKLQAITIEQLKKVEQEIAFLLSKKPS